MLKVRATDINDRDEELVDPKHSFRSFDIVEKDNKTESTGFELSHKLEVDGIPYKDFDEIIARHMDPIMENLRLLREHPRFGLRNGETTDRFEVRGAIARFSRDDRKLLHYSLLLNTVLVGHGLLVWALGGQKPREEFIEVHPYAFSLWGKPFDKLTSLIKWFKTVGWRNSTRLRQDFKEAWERRRAEAESRRGTDAYSDRPRKSRSTWQAATTTTGLQTPGGGGLQTPSGVYAHESAAPTPSGLSTPGGSRTPNPAVPGSPAPMTVQHFANPATPSGVAPGTPGVRMPQTPMGVHARPMGMMGGGSTAVGGPSIPMTPRVAPATPSALGGCGGGAPPMTPGGAAAATPGGFMTPGGRGVGMQTPGGFPGAAPATPGIGPGFPGTPAGTHMVPSSPGLGSVAPQSIGGGFRPMPATPAGMFTAPNTPGGMGGAAGVPPSPGAMGAPPPSPGAVGVPPPSPGALTGMPQTPGGPPGPNSGKAS